MASLVKTTTNETKQKINSQAQQSQIFKTLRTHLRVIGCLPFLDLPPWCKKGALQKFQFIVVLSILVLNSLSILHYFLFKASDFVEYINTAFSGSTGVLVLIQYSLFFWHKTKISQLFVKLDQIIAQCNIDYHEIFKEDLINKNFIF